MISYQTEKVSGERNTILWYEYSIQEERWTIHFVERAKLFLGNVKLKGVINGIATEILLLLFIYLFYFINLFL